MTVVALVFTGIAVLLHGYIFVMESLQWTAPRTRATFGTSAQEAEATREMAFNQGFYNLFLAIVAAVGMGFTAFGDAGIGLALVLAGAGSMVAAGLILLISSPDKARAALIQLTPPLIGCAALVIARL
ncbi:epimerase [Nocardia mangyaensis]|uniref:Epimerase n=1 Tax=Nocardia mangyaensis TaxID=2213200 RepID=A0A1J0VWE1_9NOCA|nr:DUF1304 domain-containing protein [Nocardia mangyaensis]APE36379.1 epimerase [Nocardia mangyaensis]